LPICVAVTLPAMPMAAASALNELNTPPFALNASSALLIAAQFTAPVAVAGAAAAIARDAEGAVVVALADVPPCTAGTLTTRLLPESAT
jgi:hypothetical protein